MDDFMRSHPHEMANLRDQLQKHRKELGDEHSKLEALVKTSVQDLKFMHSKAKSEWTTEYTAKFNGHKAEITAYISHQIDARNHGYVALSEHQTIEARVHELE